MVCVRVFRRGGVGGSGQTSRRWGFAHWHRHSGTERIRHWVNKVNVTISDVYLGWVAVIITAATWASSMVVIADGWGCGQAGGVGRAGEWMGAAGHRNMAGK